MEHEVVQSKTAEACRQPEVQGSDQQQTPARTSFHQILHLQRTIGNRATVRVIQAKLKASHPGDLHEHDAGGFAQGMAQAETQPKAAPLAMSQEERKKEERQRELSAAGVTPETSEGQHLLAHEVAHTVQRSGANCAKPQPKREVPTPGEALEIEADRAGADAIVLGRPPLSAGLSRRFNALAASPGNVVQRQGPGQSIWDLLPKLPPKQANWDVGPARQVDTLAGGWDEQPYFPNGVLAHEGSPELDRGKDAFIRDRDTLQNLLERIRSAIEPVQYPGEDWR